MVNYSDADLDSVFAALADPTRRFILNALMGEARPVSELAASHDMSLPGFMKHLRVLEEAGLLRREKEGRVVSCTLAARPLQGAAAWLAHYEKFWTGQLDALGRYLYQQEELQTWKPSSETRRRSASSGATPSRRKKSGAPGRTRKR
jgi:DNA-binding transcriptional ArsR family regulator